LGESAPVFALTVLSQTGLRFPDQTPASYHPREHLMLCLEITAFIKFLVLEELLTW
jgi:hypothetical protein